MSDDANSIPPLETDHAVCLGCGCLCDDIEISVADGTISRLQRVCDLGRKWFDSQHHRIETASLTDDHFAKAAAVLSGSRSPIFLGIEGLTCEAQRQFIALAELTRGVVATESFSSFAARQEVGEATATLGEIRGRADLVVFWFSDPMTTHPRHLERYSCDCRGRFVPNGRADRTLIVVDEAESATSAVADRFVRLSREDEMEALKEIRLQLLKPDLGKPAQEQSSPRPWTGLVDAMKRAKYGAMVVDPSRHPRSSIVLEELFKLVIDLNDHTSFVVSPLGPGENSKGAESVLLWSTGFPANIAFQGGSLQYHGGEYSAEELLQRARVDAAVIVGSWNRSALSPRAVEHLERIPKLQIGGEPNGAAIHIPAASWLETSGTVFRMDGVPLPIDAVVSLGLLTAEAVLGRLLAEARRSFA